jgi:hypothetical protein
MFEFLLESIMKTTGFARTTGFAKTIKTAAILLLATAGVAASAAASATDLVAVPASTPTQVTRAQVKQELQQAIANGEIRHGDLADFQSLVEPTAQRVAVAATQTKPANAARDEKAPEAQAHAAQTGAASDTSSGH